MKKTFSFIILLCFSLIPIACQHSSKKQVTAIAESAPFTVKTEIHLGNLAGRIKAISAKIRHSPQVVELKIYLSEALYEQAFYTGDLYEIQKAIDELDKARKLAKGKKQFLKIIHLMRAKQQMSLHRFNKAGKDLEKAILQGASEEHSSAISTDIAWNKGNYSEAMEYFRKRAATSPNMHSIMRVAILEHQTGNYAKANGLYQKSISLFRGGNPVHYAWTKVQHGIHKLETSDFKRAKELFLEALEVTPEYVLALEHLAETNTNLGLLKEATELYEKVVKLSKNPEFMGKLALMYKQAGRTKKAIKLIDRARKTYEVLLKKFPKAMYAHAASFFMEHGYKKVALGLLEKNLKHRPTSESYLALAEVQAELSLTAKAKETIQHTLAMPQVSPKLCDLAKKLLKSNAQWNAKCSRISSY